MSFLSTFKWVYLIIATVSIESSLEQPPEPPHLTITDHGSIQTMDSETDVNPVDKFQLSYTDFEEEIRSYIQNVRQGHMVMMSDTNKFITELGLYLAKLPKAQISTITIKSRLTCECEGKRMSPCPPNCLYSCFGLFETGKAWRPENDCRNSSFLECQCYEGSSEICDDGVSSCFTETTGEIPGDDSCGDYTVDEAKLVQSYRLFEHLLVEPLHVFIRKLELQSSFLKQAVNSAGNLFNLTAVACHGYADPTCSAASSLKTQLDSYQKLIMDMTNEMVENLDRIRNIYEGVNRLRERTLAHVNELIKGYACCLRTANFTVDDIDCPDYEPPKIDLMPPPLNKTRSRRTNVFGSYEWVLWNSSIPDYAVEAGADGGKLYAGRAPYEGDMLPAKVRNGIAYVSYAGKEYVITSGYEVLLSKDIVWKSTDSQTAIPDGAVQVGYTKNSNPLYMGRATHDGKLTPGKVQTSDGCLYIPYGSDEYKYCSYEIMVLNKFN